MAKAEQISEATQKAYQRYIQAIENNTEAIQSCKARDILRTNEAMDRMFQNLCQKPEVLRYILSAVIKNSVSQNAKAWASVHCVLSNIQKEKSLKTLENLKKSKYSECFVQNIKSVYPNIFD